MLPELIAGFTIHDHRRAARGLARGLGLEVEEGSAWKLRGPDAAARLSFDGQGRVANIEAQVR